MSEDRKTPVEEPTIAPSPEVWDVEAGDRKGVAAEAEALSLYSSYGLDQDAIQSHGAIQLTAKTGSSKDGDQDQEGVYNSQLEILEHPSQDPSTWMPEILQSITVTHQLIPGIRTTSKIGRS